MEPHIFEIQEDKVKIRGIFLGMSIETANQVLSEQDFVLEQEYSSSMVFSGYIEGFGACNLKISGSDRVCMIVVTSKQRVDEKEALAVFKQLKSELPGDPGFDWNDFGLTQRPHEIDHFWDLSEGFITIQWDGFNVHNFVTKKNDGVDYLSLALKWPTVKDESYWRSEVD